MKIKFKISAPDSKAYEQTVSGDIITIGRSNCELTLKDKSCSRQHAVIYLASTGRLMLRDLNSLNGVKVRTAGEKIKDVAVLPGVVILVGHTYVQVVEMNQKTEVQPSSAVADSEESDTKTIMVEAGSKSTAVSPFPPPLESSFNKTVKK